jgi:polysaccharide export outer membrane protein
MRPEFAAALVACASLTGCGDLPSGAPTAAEFEHPETAPGTLDYVLLDLDRATVQKLATSRLPGFAESFGRSAYRPSLVFRPGDVIAITIFDLSPISLFGANPQASSGDPSIPPIHGESATLPAQTVDLDGRITVPFGGRITVAGLSPLQVGSLVEGVLKGKSGNAQAVVSLVSSVVNSVTVGGDVGRPGEIPLTVRGERVLDVIASAGGARFESYDCDVQLVRNGRGTKVNLQRIVNEPQENVLVEPGDTVFISHNPRSFSVLGSAMKVSQYDFNADKVTLAEAMARSGGPNDSLADSGDIYLLRSETKSMINSILPPGDPRRPPGSDEQVLPVAFHLDLRRATGYLLAQALPIRDKDIILLTNADTVELQKLLGLVRGFSGIFSDFKRTQP